MLSAISGGSECSSGINSDSSVSTMAVCLSKVSDGEISLSTVAAYLH